MGHSVMPPAQKNQVRKGGLSAICPVNDVVSVAPGLGSITAWEATATVADNERSPDARRNHRRPATDLEWLRGTLREDPGDQGIARDPPGDLWCDRPNLRDLASPVALPR